MPQMKPMNWIFLYLSLNSILMLMNILNYFFNFKNKMPKFYKLYKNNNINWKW